MLSSVRGFLWYLIYIFHLSCLVGFIVYSALVGACVASVEQLLVYL